MKLRGHHLICLHFFKGKAYDKEFRNYLEKLKENMGSSDIEVVDSADDVCKKCIYLKKGRCNYSENAEAEITEMDKKALELLNIKEDTVKWKQIKDKIPGIFNEWKPYCKACDWQEDCNENSEWGELVNLK